MKDKKTLSIIAIVVLIVAIIVGINIYQSQKEPEVIKIGAILPLTGDLASYGNDTKNAVILAIEEFNNSIKKRGIFFDVLFEDSKGQTLLAVNSFNKLATINKVKGVLGPITSAEVLAVAPLANKYKIPIISPSATSPQISFAKDYVFRTINSDEVETKLFASFVKDSLQIDNVSILAIEAAGTRSYGESFKRYFEQRKGKVLDFELIQEGLSDYRNMINKILSKKPQAIYIAGYSKEIGLIVKQIREINNEVTLLSYQSAEDHRVIEIADKYVNNLIFSSTTLPEQILGVKHREFRDKFYQKFNKNPGIFAAEIYDACNILMKAILDSYENKKSLLINLYGVKNYDGASGIISFDENGDVNKPIAIYKYIGKEIKLMKSL